MNLDMIPGAILQGAVMGALRIRNMSAKQVAEQNGIAYSKFRTTIFGTSMNGAAKATREKIIDHVGRDLVEQLYRSRMLEEADKMRDAL